MPRKPGFVPPQAETVTPEDYAARSPALMPLPMSPGEFRLACRSRMPTVLSVLDRILADPTASATSQLTAAALISDRAYGKAPVIEEVDVNRSVRDMSSDELLAITRASLESEGVDVDKLMADARKGKTH